jgi:hypothetical protein
VPSGVRAAGRIPSLIAKALHVFFSSHVDAFIVTSLIHAVVFVIDFFSASRFRECCMSGLFLLGIVINKHTGHRIIAIAAIFIIHAKREILCSYGGLTFYGALNVFINTVAVPLTRYAVSDGLDYLAIVALWEGAVKTIASVTTGLLLFCGTSLVPGLWKLVCAKSLRIAFWLGVVFLVARLVWSLPRLKQLSNTFLSHMDWIALASTFYLSMIIPVLLELLFGPLRAYCYIEAVVITKQRELRADGPRYAYGTLGASQIRLLRMSRRLPFAELQCELIHTTFDEGPDYTAISYTWGDATPTHEILIDGCRAAISSSVYDILHHQRSYVGQKIIWIDSVCINQSDNDEKAKQAKLKGDIFCRASGVLVWLGKTQHSFRTLLAIARLIARKDTSSQSTEEIIRDEYLRNKEDWEALGSLFRQPWFSRVSAVKEVAVAPNIRIVYGNIVIPWDVLEEFLGYFANNNFLVGALDVEEKSAFLLFSEQESVRGVGNANRMTSVRTWYKMQQYRPLHHILRDCPRFRSSDPRDKVYALLGLTSDGPQEILSPDYSKSVESVYAESMRFMLRQDGSAIDMLLRARLGYPREFGALPSWVPDFSIDRPTPFTIRGAQVHRTGTSHVPTMMLFEGRPEILALKGTIIGEVDHVGPTFQPDEVPAPSTSLGMTEGDPTLLYLQKWFRETISLVQSHVREPYPTGESLDEVFWRTLVGDINTQLQKHLPPASSRLAEAFGDFKRYFGIDSGEDLPGCVAVASGATSDKDTITRTLTSVGEFITAFYGRLIGTVWAPINYRSRLSISNRYRLID